MGAASRASSTPSAEWCCRRCPPARWWYLLRGRARGFGEVGHHRQFLVHAARTGTQLDVLVVTAEGFDRVEDFAQVVVPSAADGVRRGLQDRFGPLVLEAGGGRASSSAPTPPPRFVRLRRPYVSLVLGASSSDRIRIVGVVRVRWVVVGVVAARVDDHPIRIERAGGGRCARSMLGRRRRRGTRGSCASFLSGPDGSSTTPYAPARTA